MYTGIISSAPGFFFCTSDANNVLSKTHLLFQDMFPRIQEKLWSLIKR